MVVVAMRQRQWKYIRIGVFIIVLIFLYVILRETTSSFGYAHVREETDDDPLPMLKTSPRQVPVVIVDEHQEVIPYWFKGVEEKILKRGGNTLIHIDAHSDMASPEDYNSLVAFKHRIPSRPSSFLPLMESNDVFIISAVLKGLINKIVWVRPRWKSDSDEVILEKGYVGSTLIPETNKRTVCVCNKERNDTYTWLPFECYYLNRGEVESNTSAGVIINAKLCRKVHSYTFIIMSEDHVERFLKLHNIESSIIDIDEDYFGVQSGVGRFIELGVQEITQADLDYSLGRIYCPRTTIGEHILNNKLRLFFRYFANEIRKETQDYVLLEKELFKSTSGYMCPPSNDEFTVDILVKYFINFVSGLSLKEIIALSKLRFCLGNSPILKTSSTSFGVCHGTIFPMDTLNQIYVGNRSEIIARGKRLERILNYLINNTELKFVTVARSLRDGYTPRDQQRFIEAIVVDSLTQAMDRNGKTPRIIYDKQLVFGRDGW